MQSTGLVRFSFKQCVTDFLIITINRDILLLRQTKQREVQRSYRIIKDRRCEINKRQNMKVILFFWSIKDLKNLNFKSSQSEGRQGQCEV